LINFYLILYTKKTHKNYKNNAKKLKRLDTHFVQGDHREICFEKLTQYLLIPRGRKLGNWKLP